MKAKDLAKILLMTPDAEVAHYQYTGGCTDVLKINDVRYINKGDIEEGDGGHFIDENNKAECDIVILGYDPNVNQFRYERKY